MAAETTAIRSKAIDSYNLVYVSTISLTAALGGLLFGYDWVVIGGAKPFYEAYFQLTAEELIGWANSCALVGCLLGASTSGVLSDRFGRKALLILSALLFAVSSLFTGLADTFWSFVTWRIVGGIAIGMASSVSPTYIAEVTPAPWRGRMVTLNQLAIVVGILAAQIVNWLIAQPIPESGTPEAIRLSWNGQEGWRWMFAVVAVPATVFFVCALWIPESPRWLMKRGAHTKAHEIMARIGGAGYADDALREIRVALDRETDTRTPWHELVRPQVLASVVTGVGLAVLQQAAGINVIFNYADEIYRGAGYGIDDVLFNIVVTGIVNLVFTVVALSFVDRVGRRLLMLIGCASIAISHAALGLSFATGIQGLPVVMLTLVAIACFAMSLAPVTWVLISEIFPNRVRALAVSISTSALWVACFAVTFTFPILHLHLGPAGTIWTYAAICVGGFLFVLRRVPETKCLSLEGIEQCWDSKRQA